MTAGYLPPAPPAAITGSGIIAVGMSGVLSPYPSAKNVEYGNIFQIPYSHLLAIMKETE
jgi:hypothetical protein